MNCDQKLNNKTVFVLKDYLRLVNAPLTGKKEDLCERLQNFINKGQLIWVNDELVEPSSISVPIENPQPLSPKISKPQPLSPKISKPLSPKSIKISNIKS